jgi:hypothetical protein
MTLNEIIGNKEKTSRIDTNLWKKLNEKYSDNSKTKNRATQIPNYTNLEQQIIYDTTGKPNIQLIPLRKTAINIQTQKEYDNLM